MDAPPEIQALRRHRLAQQVRPGSFSDVARRLFGLHSTDYSSPKRGS